MAKYKDLISKLAYKYDFDYKEAKVLVDLVISTIKDSLLEGNAVSLNGIGIIYTVHVPQKVLKSNLMGDVISKEKCILKFRPSATLSKEITERLLNAEKETKL